MAITGVMSSIALLMLGCVLNNIELEFIISKKLPHTDPRAGALLTFLQFVFIAVVSVPHSFEWIGWTTTNSKLLQFPARLKKTVVPLREYFIMATYFCVMSFLNNLAFAFHISQPMHMVFRSSNLMVSYVYGWALGRSKHDPTKLLSVVLLTIGAALATMAETRVGDTAAAVAKLSCNTCDGGLPGTANASAQSASADLYFLEWCIGVAILTTVLLLQTMLGARQDDASKAYGKAPFEAMFYMHALPLPMLAVLGWKDAMNSIGVWSSSPRADHIVAAAAAQTPQGSVGRLAGSAFLSVSGWLSTIGLGYSSLPVLVLHAGMNVFTQWVCLVGVYNLISQADQLTVNVTLTVRKFVSLMASIAIFSNTFTIYHWAGAVLVFGGAALYGAAPQVSARLWPAPPSSRQPAPILAPLKRPTNEPSTPGVGIVSTPLASWAAAKSSKNDKSEESPVAQVSSPASGGAASMPRRRRARSRSASATPSGAGRAASARKGKGARE